MSELVLSKGDEGRIIEITKAISSATRFKIISLLQVEEMDISTLAEKLEQTEANVSAQVKQLERAKLVESRYTPGEHGVRKICKTAVSRLVIDISS
ncbi:MAG: helix-turn-helix domain-containing protein [Candidatus Heimdallarchaeota archaeon]|nr:helix-turn-helix domain-containing protein [Candidatus Heimdallarchaeota archaeon]